MVVEVQTFVQFAFGHIHLFVAVDSFVVGDVMIEF